MNHSISIISKWNHPSESSTANYPLIAINHGFVSWETCHVLTNIVLFHFYCLLDISKDKWEKMTSANGWNSVELRDNRYNQIVHMVSAANGAEDFYSTEVSKRGGNPVFSFSISVQNFQHIQGSLLSWL